MEKSVQWTTKIDFDHLISDDQIRFTKNDIVVGDWLEFKDGERKITGVVTKKYDKGFLMDDGRFYSYKQVILGNKRMRYLARVSHPIVDPVEYDRFANLYLYRMQRYK